LTAARRYRSRMGHAVFLALVCLPSFLTATAQSLSASPPDLHQLQQQVAIGQEDDITVLTLQFAPAEVAHA
jgi:hypothetical protein